MRLRGAVCAVTVALATFGVAVAPAPATTASCGPAKARTLASSSQARVYELKGVAYGCAGKTQYRLGRRQSPCSPCVGLVVVAGTVAAYSDYVGGYDFVDAEVHVRSLADGKRLFDRPAITYEPRAEPVESVDSLVAKPDGHVAWIAVSTGIGGPTHRLVEVHRGRTVLDHGPKIDPHSLKLQGTLLSWKHGSKTRHASLR